MAGPIWVYMFIEHMSFLVWPRFLQANHHHIIIIASASQDRSFPSYGFETQEHVSKEGYGISRDSCALFYFIYFIFPHPRILVFVWETGSD